MSNIKSFHNTKTFYQACCVLRSVWISEQLPYGPGFSECTFRRANIHIFRLLSEVIENDSIDLYEKMKEMIYA